MKVAPSIEVGFAVRSIDDIVLSVGGYTPPQDTSVADLNDNTEGYWTQKDNNENWQLCTVIPFGTTTAGIFKDGNSEQYQLTATNFVYAGFVGGRPIHRPHAQ